MNITRHILSAALLCLAVPAWSATEELPLFRQVDGPHAVMDDLNLLLLYALRTGQPFDPIELAEMTDGRAPDDVRQALAQYRAASGARERFERRAMLEFALQERQDRLRGGIPYVFALASLIGAFDAGNKRFPLKLSLDSTGQSGDPGRYCLPSYRIGGGVVACLASSSLASGDPIFSSLPVENAATAALIAARHAQGKLRLFAVAEDAGGATLAQGAREPIWSQPVKLTGLLLVDTESGKLLGVAKAQGPGQAQGAGQAAGATGKATPPGGPGGPGEGQLAGQTGRMPPAPTDPAGTPSPGQPPGMPPLPAPGADPAPGTGQQAPEVAEAPVPEVDRLLSLLSLAVYSDADKLRLAKADIAEVEAKIFRIEHDPGRNEGVRIKELKKLAIELGKKQRRFDEHQAMLALKDALPSRYGLRPVAVDRAAKSDRLHYERYRLRDGRHVLVFRGTDNRADFETDFQLATTPEMLNEMAGKLKSSGGGVRGALGDWMRERGDRQVATNPAAFQLADMVVGALVRSGVAPSKIVLTGHSLGGGLAQYAGLRNGVGLTVSFNPAPLSPGLIQQLPAGAVHASARSYVSFVPRPGGDGGTFDPVSSALADITTLRNPASLRVLGDKRIVTVCNDLEGEDYQAFSNAAQGIVTNLTLSTMAVGKGRMAKGGAVYGAVTGGQGAGTDIGSAVAEGSGAGRKTGKILGAGMNCLRNPFLCSAVAAGGGIISVATRMKLPEVWSLYTAHSMKMLNAALQEEGPPACTAERLPFEEGVSG